MDDRLFQALLELTGQRDSEEVETRLVRIVPTLFPVRAASVIRLASENLVESAEVLVSCRRTGQGSTSSLQLLQEAVPRAPDEVLRLCLQDREPRSCQLPSGYQLLVPVVDEHRVDFVLELESDADPSPYLHSVAQLCRLTANFLAVLRESERDKLTGLFNRRTFDAKLGRMLATQRRKALNVARLKGSLERRSISLDANAWLAVMDIDFFKRINDTFGHVYGDEVILLLAQKMRSFFRNTDLLFRFGGEEFIIILEPLPREMAAKALNRYRESVAKTVFPQIGGVTVSLGFAEIGTKDFPATIIDRADKALYYAKQHGRNCLFNYEQLVEEGALPGEARSGSIDLF